MGLDTFAYRQNQVMPKELFKHVPDVLVGGMFSGNGGSPSFRGKVYDDFILHVTGETLYQECIPNLVVHKMVAALKDFLKEFPDATTYQKMDMKKSEAQALLKWMQVVADNDGDIVGWW